MEHHCIGKTTHFLYLQCIGLFIWQLHFVIVHVICIKFDKDTSNRQIPGLAGDLYGPQTPSYFYIPSNLKTSSLHSAKFS